MKKTIFGAVLAAGLALPGILGTGLTKTTAAAGAGTAWAAEQEQTAEQAQAAEQKQTAEQEQTATESDAAAAGNLVPATESDASPAGTVTEISEQEALEALPAVVLHKGEEDPLYEQMLEFRFVKAVVLLANGEEKTLRLRVDWDLAQLSTDFQTPGTYTETASILVPDGYVFADGVLSSVSIPVTVLETEAQPDRIVQFSDISDCYAWAVPLDCDWDAFFEQYFSDSLWQYSWPCTLESGETAYAHITWENPQPDTGETGIVTVHGTAVLPEDTVLADTVSLPEIDVSVSIQKEGEPDLNCWFLNYGAVNLPWVSGGLEEIARVLVAENGGDWEENDLLFFCDNLYVHLSLAALETGASYRVKAVWDGGETGVFSFTWDGDVTQAGYYKGDRDGGDAAGNPPADIILPAQTETETGEKQETEGTEGGRTEASPGTESNPGKAAETRTDAETKTDTETQTNSETKTYAETKTNPETKAKPTPASKTAQEYFGETTDRISGARYLLMLEAGNQIAVFSKQGIKISLPASALKAVGVQPEDTLEIQIQQKSGSQRTAFSFSLSVNGTPVTSLPGASAMLPLPETAAAAPAAGTVFLLDETGKRCPMDAYDSAARAASFRIDRSGSFTLYIEETAQEASGREPAILPGQGRNPAKPSGLLSFLCLYLTAAKSR